MTNGTCSSAPEAAFASTPVASGLWRAVVTMAVTANAAAERKIAPTLCGSVIWSSTSTTPSVGKFLDRRRGQRIGLQIKALMHGVGRQPRRDRVGPHDLRRRRGRDLLVGEAAGGVFGGEELAHPPRRILQRRRDRMPAIEHGGVVGRLQALALGALEPLAALDLLVGRAGLVRPGSGSIRVAWGGLWVEMAWRGGILAVCGERPSIDFNRVGHHKPTHSTGRRGLPFVLRDQYGATVWESVPSGKGGGL